MDYAWTRFSPICLNLFDGLVFSLHVAGFVWWFLFFLVFLRILRWVLIFPYILQEFWWFWVFPIFCRICLTIWFLPERLATYIYVYVRVRNFPERGYFSVREIGVGTFPGGRVRLTVTVRRVRPRIGNVAYTELHEFPWKFMEFHELPWKFTGFHDFPWKFTGFNEFPWNFMGFHELPFLGFDEWFRKISSCRLPPWMSGGLVPSENNQKWWKQFLDGNVVLFVIIALYRKVLNFEMESYFFWAVLV